MNKPMEICKAALIAKGMPQDLVNKLEPGRRTDILVYFIVMQDQPWQAVLHSIEKAEKNLENKQ